MHCRLSAPLCADADGALVGANTRTTKERFIVLAIWATILHKFRGIREYVLN
jgi:hypothetical protein